MARHFLVSLELDDGNGGDLNPAAAHERTAAITDLLERNHFRPLGEGPGGPYHLRLSVVDGRLAFDVRNLEGEEITLFILPVSPFRAVVREYFAVCDSYYAALRAHQPDRLETIDMGRRGLHNEAANLLQERLASHVEVDHETSRRLFTLMCVLHLREMA